MRLIKTMPIHMKILQYLAKEIFWKNKNHDIRSGTHLANRKMLTTH